MNRVIAGLIAFVVLGILAWTTIGDQRLRLVTLAILAMFAFRTWVHRKHSMHAGKGSDVEQ